MIEDANTKQAPWNGSDSCTNCGGNGEPYTATNGKEGCTECILECPGCDQRINSEETYFYPNIYVLKNNAWITAEICEDCYDGKTDSPDDYEHIRLSYDPPLFEKFGEMFKPPNNH